METSHNTVQKTFFHDDGCYNDHWSLQSSKKMFPDNQQTILIDEKPLYDNWIIG